MRWSAPNVSAIACTMIAQLGKFYNHRLAIYECFRLIVCCYGNIKSSRYPKPIEECLSQWFCLTNCWKSISTVQSWPKKISLILFQWNKMTHYTFLAITVQRHSKVIMQTYESLWRWYPVHHARWLNFKAKPWQKLITVAANGKIINTTVARTRFWSQEYK